MPTTLYHLLVFVHLMAALVWLGGMFFFALVGAPVLRTLESTALRTRLFHQLGVRFRTVGWWSIGLLVVTGLGILHVRGVLRWEVLSDVAWWGTPFGRALAWKLVLVGIMVAVSAHHDFVVGPRASRLETDPVEPDPAHLRARRQAVLLARANAVAGLVLVYWAMRLARGG